MPNNKRCLQWIEWVRIQPAICRLPANYFLYDYVVHAICVRNAPKISNLSLCSVADVQTELDTMRWFFHPSPPGGHAMVSSVAACCVRPTTHALPCIVNGDDSAVFRFCPRWPWPLTPKFELERDFCTVYLTAKFHHLTFNRSEVIVRTNKHTDKLTNKQTPLETFTALRYATPVDKKMTGWPTSPPPGNLAVKNGRFFKWRQNSVASPGPAAGGMRGAKLYETFPRAVF